MGLDVTFYEITKNEVSYFSKVNFFLTYFGITDEQNGVDVQISKDELAGFVADLKCELTLYKDRRAKEPDGAVEIEPINPKFRATAVPFGGSTLYTDSYWYDLKDAKRRFENLLRDFDWDNSKLVINCWW